MIKIYQGPDRRKYIRAPKNFGLHFYGKSLPFKKFTGTFIKDIGKGGMRFTSPVLLKIGSVMVFEIGIPHVAPGKFIVEGTVVSCREISKLVHEVRAKFDSMDEQSMQVLDMIEKQILKDHKSHGYA